MPTSKVSYAKCKEEVYLPGLKGVIENSPRPLLCLLT